MNWIAAVAVLFLAYAMFSRKLSHSPVTGPMVFATAGVAMGAFLSWSGMDSGTVLTEELQTSAIQGLLEVTLVILLFSDAVAIDYAAVRKEAFLPGRLLGIGLPITMIVGAAVAMLMFPGLGFWSAAVVAVVLAPTDAALGQAVVSNKDVPDLVRQGIAVESGLNDGIAVPFLTIAIAAAAGEMATGTEIATVFFKEIGLAVLVGVLVGAVGGKLLLYAFGRGWMTREWRQVAVIAFALLSFSLADPVGGSGFIAAFVGGIAFGHVVRRTYPDITGFSEGVSHVLTMLAFFVFGLLILFPALEFISWKIVVYAILSLTVIRIIPVFLALSGTSLAIPTKLYIGWFGPRGLASLVFAGTVVIESTPVDGRAILTVAGTVVMMSIYLHGLTAWPGSVVYARWFKRSLEAKGEEKVIESKPVEHLGARIRENPKLTFSPDDSDDHG